MISGGWNFIDVCPLCGGKELPAYESVISTPALDAQDFIGGPFRFATPVHYLKCTDCGLVIQSPRLTDERLNHYYADGIYRATIGSPQEKMDAGEKDRALGIAAWLLETGITYESHLDLGCSRGYLLQETHKTGAKVLGYEPYEDYPEDGVPVTREWPGKQFGLVSVIHVLEHVPDPVNYLGRAAALSYSYLLVEVPWESSQGVSLGFPHLYSFSRQILRRMLLDVGFVPREENTDKHLRILAERTAQPVPTVDSGQDLQAA